MPELDALDATLDSMELIPDVALEAIELPLDEALETAELRTDTALDALTALLDEMLETTERMLEAALEMLDPALLPEDVHTEAEADGIDSMIE